MWSGASSTSWYVARRRLGFATTRRAYHRPSGERTPGHHDRIGDAQPCARPMAALRDRQDARLGRGGVRDRQSCVLPDAYVSLQYVAPSCTPRRRGDVEELLRAGDRGPQLATPIRALRTAWPSKVGPPCALIARLRRRPSSRGYRTSRAGSFRPTRLSAMAYGTHAAGACRGRFFAPHLAAIAAVYGIVGSSFSSGPASAPASPARADVRFAR
jgi:hypothetical protein